MGHRRRFGHDRSVTASGRVTVLPVRDGGELRRFLDVPYQLHREESRWVPPLRSDLVARVRVRRNPFWKRADGLLLLARRGSALVGRISVHRDLADGADRRTAFWGWFDAADAEAAAALLESARAWGREVGASSMVGPASFHALDEAGLLVEGREEAASFLSPWHPAAYEGMVIDAGLVEDGELVTLRLPVPAGAPVTRPARLRDVGQVVADRTGDLPGLVAGHPAAWALTVAEVRARFARWRPAMDARLCVLSDAGVAVAIPDLTEVLVRIREGSGPGAVARALRAARREPAGAAVAFLAGDPGPLLRGLVEAAGGAGYRHLDVTVAVTAAAAVDAVAAGGGRPQRRYRCFRMTP